MRRSIVSFSTRIPDLTAVMLSQRGGLVLLAAIFAGAPVMAQGPPPPTLRLAGVLPEGVRSSATESWGTYSFQIENLTDVERQARVVAFYSNQPDVHYSRDVWLPPRSMLRTWMLVGPVRPVEFTGAIETLLFDRTGGKEVLLLPTHQKERVRDRLVLYRQREPSTSVLLDEEYPEEVFFGQLPQPEPIQEEVIRFVQTWRNARGLSEYVSVIAPGTLPPTEQAFDGIDHLVIASNRWRRDAAGIEALRHWVQGGGHVWVMLDLVGPDIVPALLGDGADFQIVDRTRLTTTTLATAEDSLLAGPPFVGQHDRPVTLTRVLLPGPERVDHSVDGWPVWFSREVGRGRVVFTTLGGRGWHRRRTPSDAKSPFSNIPDLPVHAAPLVLVAEALEPPQEARSAPLDAFRPMLTEEIGYAVVGRGVVLAIFGGALAAALATGIALRRSRHPEWAGWLGPAAALVAMGAFLAVGHASRQATPTVAVAQVVYAAPHQAEANLVGLAAVYRPDSGLAEMGAARGGRFDLDMDGLEQSRTFVLSDMDAWRWEDLSLPAGVRFAPFRFSARLQAPLAAVARFGPDGLVGKLSSGPWGDLADCLLSAVGDRALAVQVQADGTFQAGGNEALAPGQFIASAVLSDRQRQRQEIFRELLKRSVTRREQEHNVLYAWSKPIDMGFTLADQPRQTGSALLIAPLELRRGAAGERVSVPGALIPYRRIVDQKRTRATFESAQGADMHLRFQLPPEVLPLKVERARLLAKIDAASRRVTVSGHTGTDDAKAARVELHRQDSPLGPISVDITEERLLQLDSQGGLHLSLAISDLLQADKANMREASGEKWVIDFIELEVTGTVQASETRSQGSGVRKQEPRSDP